MDNFKDQLAYFISKSPDFFNDGSLAEIDIKHQGIVSSAYDLLNSDFSIEKLRNWSGQSDMGIKRKFNSFYAAMVGMKNYPFFLTKIMSPVADKVNSLLQGGFTFSMHLDDIAIIEAIGGRDLLLENPQSETPGAAPYPLINGYSVSTRWLRYIYLLTRMREKKLLGNDGAWVDIGSFYGGLQGLVKKYHPSAKIILVDFHHQLLRSYIYLNTMFPGSKHFLPSEVDQFKGFSEMPEGSFMYVPVNDYHKIQSHKANLVSNFFSLGEMRREHFDGYFNSNLLQNADHIYLVNRFVSSPFFEKTYDTDITVKDYLNTSRKSEYFDVFPVNHYLSIRRNLFGRNYFRNLSSSYFELIY
jgi:putative sugar O-methyltransferase